MVSMSGAIRILRTRNTAGFAIDMPVGCLVRKLWKALYYEWFSSFVRQSSVPDFSDRCEKIRSKVLILGRVKFCMILDFLGYCNAVETRQSSTSPLSAAHFFSLPGRRLPPNDYA